MEVAGIDYERKYGRDDVDYHTWYSDWSKRLARTMTREQILHALGANQQDVGRATQAHLRAVQSTTSMSSNSQRRAQSRNVVAAEGEKGIALSGALEIHDLFPEHALTSGEET